MRGKHHLRRPSAPRAQRPCLLPLEGRTFLAAGGPYGGGDQDTSRFMIGDVVVSVVLMESNGSRDVDREDWSDWQIQHVKQSVAAGLEWWVQTYQLFGDAAPRDALDFEIDFTYADNPVATGYEPISRSSFDDSLWIGDFARMVGGDGRLAPAANVRAFDRQQAAAHDADWAFTIFVVNSQADGDGAFPNGSTAYSMMNGPYLVLTWDSGAWGSQNMPLVIAHEVGHIFGALDEYPASDSYTRTSGCYDTQNLNASDGHPAPQYRVASIMNEQTQLAYDGHLLAPSTAAALGWRDGDGDGVMDVLDVPLLLEGDGSYDAGAGVYRFSGMGQVQTLEDVDAGSNFGITINTVDRLQYRLDNGAWQDVGAYDAYSVNLAAEVAVGEPGRHTIAFRVIDQGNGVSSNVISQDFLVSGQGPEGTIYAFDARHKAVVTDAAGRRLVVSMRGEGWGELVMGTAGSLRDVRVRLNETGAKTVVSLTADRRAGATLAELTVGGPVRTIVARNLALAGTVDAEAGYVGRLELGDVVGASTIVLGALPAGQVAALKLRRVTDLSIDSRGAIGSLVAKSWVDSDGAADALVAPAIGKLAISGQEEFGANLVLTPGEGVGRALGRAVIAGPVSGEWTLHGDAGIVRLGSTVAGWSAYVGGSVGGFSTRGDLAGNLVCRYVGKLSVGGSMTGATVELSAGGDGAARRAPAIVVKGWLDSSTILSSMDLAAVTVGAIRDSAVRAGGPVSPAAAPPGEALQQELILPGCSIGKFTVRGSLRDADGCSVVNFDLVAARLGRVQVRNAQTDNASHAFGILADEIGVLTYRDATTTRRWKALQEAAQSFALQDLQVTLV